MYIQRGSSSTSMEITNVKLGIKSYRLSRTKVSTKTSLKLQTGVLHGEGGQPSVCWGSFQAARTDEIIVPIHLPPFC